MALRTSSDLEADAAFWATWHDLRHPLAATARGLGRPLAGDPKRQAASEAAARLLAGGVQVAVGAPPQHSDEARDLVLNSPWLTDLPQGACLALPDAEAPLAGPAYAAIQPQGKRRLLGMILRGLDLVRATRLHAAGDPAGQAALLAAGGPGVGSVWTAMPAARGTAMSNEHWTAAARRRLSILTRPEDAQSCALPTGQEDEKCGAPLDRHVRHAQCCNARPAHKRTHKALAAALRNAAEQAGASCDLERHEPSWLRQMRDGAMQEAYSDVRITWPGSLRVFRVDVTVRSPHAARYRAAHGRAGAAADLATAEKLQRYRPTGDVLPHEAYGRVGGAGLRLLTGLCEEARQWGPLRLGKPVGLNARSLRGTLEAALLRAQAGECGSPSCGIRHLQSTRVDAAHWRATGTCGGEARGGLAAQEPERPEEGPLWGWTGSRATRTAARPGGRGLSEARAV